MLAKVPAPVRFALAGWMLISLAFYLGLPCSTENVPPALRFIVLLPIALISLGLGALILWQGGLTIYRTIFCAVRGVAALGERDDSFSRFIGGVGALNIYLVVYSGTALGLARALGGYTISVILSGLIAITMGFLLFRRGRQPKDVKFFLWGGSLITIVFGILMATMAVPLAAP